MLIFENYPLAINLAFQKPLLLQGQLLILSIMFISVLLGARAKFATIIGKIKTGHSTHDAFELIFPLRPGRSSAWLRWFELKAVACFASRQITSTATGGT